jgi:hypothetical protein
MNIILNATEQGFLFRPVSGDGGFQGLLRNLRRKINRVNGEITLTPADLEKIPRYAFEYGNGGWEGRLRGIFERHLGPDLN